MIAPRLTFGCDLCDAEVRMHMHADRSWGVTLHQRGDTIVVPAELIPQSDDLAQLAVVVTDIMRAHPCTGSPN